jgi:hypothetical protein
VHLVISGLKYLLNAADRLNRGQLIWFYYNRLYGQVKAIEMMKSKLFCRKPIFWTLFLLRLSNLQSNINTFRYRIGAPVNCYANKTALTGELPFLNGLEDEVINLTNAKVLIYRHLLIGGMKKGKRFLLY